MREFLHRALQEIQAAATNPVRIGLAIALILAATAGASGREGFAGHWEGSIDVPGGLAIKVDLKQEGASWSGTIDIPTQGAVGLALGPIEVSEAGIRFEISGVPGHLTFEGNLAEEEIRGTFTQESASFPFHLGREDSEKDQEVILRRPQEPKRPFPYGEEEVTLTSGEITLAGTLTFPGEGGPFPGVVLLSGSGSQNRDEEVAGHKPFLVLSDYLTRAGIAVLRLDDRGVGGSTGSVTAATATDLADDALAGIHYLHKRGDISKDAVGVLGHSEGGMIAALAASMSQEVDFVIMLAGDGVPGEELIYEQTRLLLTTNGATAEVVERSLATQKELFNLLKSEPDDTIARQKVTELFKDKDTSMGEADLDRVLSPWFRFFLTYDPRSALRNVNVPVLALNGEQDLQVSADQNLPAIAEALEQAGNESVTIKRFPGLNHLFQACQTGNLAEYSQIEETMHPEVLELIAEWILEHL